MQERSITLLVLKKAETQEELNEVYQLRYKVYCQERRFESESCYPDKKEVDEYDPYSIHFIAKIDNKPVGTSRLILNSPVGYPIEKSCTFHISNHKISNENIAEVSRLAVSKDIKKSKGYDRGEVVLGLIREMVMESKNIGITFYYAAMSRSLHKILGKCSISFFQAGPEVNYRGLRAPYVSWRKYIEEGLAINKNNSKNISLKLEDIHNISSEDSSLIESY